MPKRKRDTRGKGGRLALIAEAWVVALAGAFLAVAVAGCGSSSTSGSAATVTQTQTVQSTTEAAPKDTSTSESGSGGGKIAVPNVVGKNHQDAQDEMQAHGLYNLSEEDATGEGRMLIIDRNWHVVSQDPPAGTKVSEDADITLRSKKYTDP
jgi:beta-lactam-binding protein with PASTA domain